MIAMQARVPHLVVLTDDVSESPCYETCEKVRDISSVPVILLCREKGSDHVAKALVAGADDHLSSVVSAVEFVARVRALLRRNQISGYLKDVITVGELSLDCHRAVCAVDGKEIQLTPSQFRLLRTLASNPGHIFTHQELIEHVWGSSFHAGDENLRKLVQRVRSTLSDITDSRTVIAAVPRFGYVLQANGTKNGA
jgi:DNA-binding response OmpR family regulator